MYEVGLLVNGQYGVETVEWPVDLGNRSTAVKVAMKYAKKCPFLDTRGRTIVAANVTCHSVEDDSEYHIHWVETYRADGLNYRIDY